VAIKKKIEELIEKLHNNSTRMVRLKAFILATSVFVLLTCISIFFLYEWKDLQSLIFTSTIDKARAEKALTEKSVWSDSSLQPHTVLALARLPDFSPSLGVRYLYEKYNLILVSEPVRNNQVCVHAISGDGSSSDPPSMKIWIRVSGPEIQSGVAVPSSPDSSCSYHYDLHPLPPGNYTLDMKLLSVFDDGQEWDFAQCNHEQGTYWDPANSTLLMYKFPISYANSDTKLCCDQCTGHPNCMAYTSNPTKNQIGEVDYPCIFYSEVSGEKLKGGKTSSGTSRSKDHVMKYLGCGHSHVFETCREAGEDDGLYLIEKEFFVSGEVGVEEEKKPICSATELDEITRGRWVKTPLSVCAGEPLQHYNNQQFAHVVRQTGMAEACWVHDNFSKISGQCVRSRRPQSSVWKSHLFEPDFTYTWQPYTCRLPLYTDAILKECLQTKGYRRPEVSGDSVSRMLGTYVVCVSLRRLFHYY